MNPAVAASPDHDTPVGWRWAPAWVLAYAVLWPASRVSEAVLSLGALLVDAGLPATAQHRPAPAAAP